MNRRAIYLEILSRGLLDIRAHCDDRTQVFAQADHLHDLPNLLANPDNEELHDFYWNCTRRSYVRACKPQHAGIFDDPWAQLENPGQKADPDSSEGT